MLFVAGFVVYMLCSALRQFHSATTEYTYKVHHNSFIEIVWTTIPALLLYYIAVPSFTLLVWMKS
jgi:heme/copper-type cytochrome/quinol oxidase subunit 2